MSTEDLIRDALRDRADGVEAQRTSMADVISTAQGIRRRRRTVVVLAAAAAVVAVAVPTATFVGRDRSGSSPLPGTNGPTAPLTTGAPQVDVQDLPQGEPPRIAYLQGNVFVSAEGNRTTLPLQGVTNATPYHGGFLAAVTGPDLGPRVVLLDNELHEVWRRCGQGGFAVSADGLSTVYVTGGCDEPLLTVSLGVTTGMGEGEQSERLPRELEYPVGVLGGAAVTSAAPDQGGWITDFSGESHRIPGLGLVGGVSESNRLVSGQLDGHPRTGGVVDVDTGEVLWDTAGWFLEDFSPDGSKVLGVRSDGQVRGWAVFDAATGDLLSESEVPPGPQVHTVAWEDDQHLLATVTQDGSGAILRIDRDGAMERATEPASYDGGDSPPFVLAPHA